MRGRLICLWMLASMLPAVAASAQASPHLGFTISTHTVDVGQPVRVSGSVRPNETGHFVFFQEYVSHHRWRKIGHARLNRRSKFSTTLSFHAPGALTIRAVLRRGNGRSLSSGSRGIKLAVLNATTLPEPPPPPAPPPPPPAPPPLLGIHKIQHVVVIMQENRSFDSYFGTYPGADGFPPGVCVPDPHTGGCVAPYHDPNNLNHGGPHDATAAVADLGGGQMNGFIAQAEHAQHCMPDGTNCQTDVMGYHDAREIPNYWAYANNFVLQDHMFEPNASWSLPEHLFLVSEWSALCTSPDPSSCVNSLNSPGNPESNPPPNYAWTDLTYLLHKAGISWGYYVTRGLQPDCASGTETCTQPKQAPKTPGIWNPLPQFETVKQDGQLGNIQDLSSFYSAAQSGNLPAVSWVVPNGKVSEHPPALVSDGQTYVTNLVNTIMNGPDWSSTAIFLSWDDWGGFYDHVVPPVIDQNGYGFRVPGMVISPYAKTGFIDHQVLSHDAYVKFIEDDFLNGQRLNPATDGRPDPRPSVREAASQLGTLTSDFNFNQQPRSPLILTP